MGIHLLEGIPDVSSYEELSEILDGRPTSRKWRGAEHRPRAYFITILLRAFSERPSSEWHDLGIKIVKWTKWWVNFHEAPGIERIGEVTLLLTAHRRGNAEMSIALSHYLLAGVLAAQPMDWCELMHSRAELAMRSTYDNELARMQEALELRVSTLHPAEFRKHVSWLLDSAEKRERFLPLLTKLAERTLPLATECIAQREVADEVWLAVLVTAPAVWFGSYSKLLLHAHEHGGMEFLAEELDRWFVWAQTQAGFAKAYREIQAQARQVADLVLPTGAWLLP